jgi:hypothetical protein
MRLTLRKNHFFRSFWSINRVTKPTKEDIKYFDLDTLNKKTCADWTFEGGTYRRRGREIYSALDLSYWNTYSLVSYHLPGSVLEFYVCESRVYGTRNFRTDNMTNRQFFSISRYTSKQYFSNAWKTAHLTRLYIDANPHWNLYNCEKYKKISIY